MPILYFAPKKLRMRFLKLKKYCEYFIYILIGSAIILLYMNYVQIKTLNDALGGY
jgi:hypothetical protein